MSDDIFIVTQPEDPIVAPIIDGLFAEYEQRYGDFLVSGKAIHRESTSSRTAFLLRCCVEAYRLLPARLNATTAPLPRLSGYGRIAHCVVRGWQEK